LYAWFNFPDLNSVYSCHFYLAGLSQQQKLQGFQLGKALQQPSSLNLLPEAVFHLLIFKFAPAFAKASSGKAFAN
jgi:hypothetical protein